MCLTEYNWYTFAVFSRVVLALNGLAVTIFNGEDGVLDSLIGVTGM